MLEIPELQSQAINGLADLGNEDTPEKLISAYPTFPNAVKRDAIATLISQPRYVTKTLDAIEAKKISRNDLHAYHIRQITNFKDSNIQKRLKEVWGEVREASADKKKRIHELTQLLQPTFLKSANLSNGRQLFNKNCATCHTLFGFGEKVGPDITGSNRANLSYILDNIVDPSAVLGNDYRMSTIVTSAGRVISGMVVKETDSALTVRTINDTVLIAKSEIEERSLSAKSLMPEGLLAQLTKNQIRDLIGYLASPTQVPIKGARTADRPNLKSRQKCNRNRIVGRYSKNRRGHFQSKYGTFHER